MREVQVESVLWDKPPPYTPTQHPDPAAAAPVDRYTGRQIQRDILNNLQLKDYQIVGHSLLTNILGSHEASMKVEGLSVGNK